MTYRVILHALCRSDTDGTLEFVEHLHIYYMVIRDDVDWTCSFPDICEGGFKQSDESHY